MDIVDEGRRLVAHAVAEGVAMRLLGGVGVRLRCPSASQPPFARTYGDLDFVAPRRSGRLVTRALEGAGYTADRRFNALHGDKRLIFMDIINERKIDVFLGTFQMCHTLDLDDRITLEQVTLPLADLLLTKLQIVQLNTKDALDALALLTDHPIAASSATDKGAADPQSAPMDGGYIASLCGADWGWYTTVTDNLAKVAQIGASLDDGRPLEPATTRIEELRALIEAHPKSIKWKLRAGVGRRIQWYEEPEEVRH